MTDKNLIVVTPDMPIDKIQEFLKKSGYTIKFSSGTYDITKTLKLFSNTKIYLNDAVLIRKNPNQVFINYLNPKLSYDYNATENVTIYGSGEIRGDGSKKVCSTISLMHCNNFTFTGITFSHTFKSHAIDLCGCSNVNLNKVKFKDRVDNINKLYKEEVNIDFSYYSGYPYYSKGSKCYNNNCCKNIVFDGVEFSNISTCVGSHTENYSTNKHEMITVRNCTANGNGKGNFLNLANTKGIAIENNIVKGFQRCIFINTLNKFYDKNGNSYSTIPNGKTGCLDISIKNNLLANAKGKEKASGIYIVSQNDVIHNNIEIKDNKFALNNPNSKYDIYVYNSSDVATANNNTKLEVKVN